MSTTPSHVTVGRVITAWIDGEDGRGYKLRPAIVVSPVQGSGLFVVAVVTTRLDAADADKLEIPSGSRAASTGLFEASAVNCRWLRALHVEDVIQTTGFVPTERLRDVLAAVGAAMKRGAKVRAVRPE
jgi:mRNA-degrading endonuclease toxin of MazEF toxin-antitoxin module